MQCAKCGVVIQARTSEKYFGLCAPCYRNAISTPPDDFELPVDLAARVRLHPSIVDFLREIAWRQGAGEAHAFIDRMDETARECERWLPVLRSFAANCRLVAPAPSVESLSEEELAQYRILRVKMTKFVESDSSRILEIPDRAAILTTTRIGLTAASELFRGSRVVILEHAERERWFADVYKRPESACWWYAFAWWTVETRIGESEAAWIDQNFRISANATLWTVRTGILWGPLAGGGRDEIWEWNGQREMFIGECSSWVS